MDEMLVNLGSNFMRNAVSKLLSMWIRKKYGCKVDIQIDELYINMINGETTISTKVEAKLESKEFTKLLNSAGLD